MLESELALLSRHLRPAAYAAALFGFGIALSVPVVRLRLRAIQWLPVRLLGLVARLMGPRPTVARMAIVIWLFNSAVMFLCVAGGFHAAVPMVLCIWTGLNVAVASAHAARDGSAPWEAFARAGPDRWRPPRWLALAGGAAVLALELPCFWLSVAMGITLGLDVGQGGAAYLAALAPRAGLYAGLVVPALLVSALAESVAIRGANLPPTRSGSHPRR